MLDRKLVRDLRHMWAQALAIALVIASGVATFVLASGAYHSLEETRATYYLRYRFADVFAEVRRAPKSIAERILTIPGVAAAEPRITHLALLDVPGLAEPDELTDAPAALRPGLRPAAQIGPAAASRSQATRASAVDAPSER